NCGLLLAPPQVHSPPALPHPQPQSAGTRPRAVRPLEVGRASTRVGSMPLPWPVGAATGSFGGAAEGLPACDGRLLVVKGSSLGLAADGTLKRSRARDTSTRPERCVEAICSSGSSGRTQESSSARLMRLPLGASPRSTSRLMSRPATPETVAAAKLVPEARQRPPPTHAPGTAVPGASTPWGRCPGPQLLLMRGAPSSPCAPTASTPGTDAGMVSQAQPWLPAAATTSTSRALACCRASLSSCDSDRPSACWEALMLMMLAPLSSALRMPAASSSCVQMGWAPSAPARKMGMEATVH